MGNRLSLPQKLHKAVKDNNAQSVQDVCKRAVIAGPAMVAATLEHKDDKGRTPLLLAASRGHVQIAKLLLQYGANLQHMRRCGNGGSALHEAAAVGSEAVARLLLEKGADPFQENFAGKMPLEVASAMKHAALVRLLEAQGLMKGYVDLKVPTLAGISSTWQTRWLSIFCRRPSPAEARHGDRLERLEAWLFAGPESSQPKCRIVLEGCHAVVAGPELKLTLRNDYVEPDNAYCPRCPSGSYIVSLRAAPHYDSHFNLLVRCLSASKQMQVAHYNGLSDTQLPALQSGFATGPSAENSLEAGGLLVSPVSARRTGAGGGVLQEPSAPLLDAAPSTPRGPAPLALARSPGPKPASPGANRTSWGEAETPDSTAASDTWGTLGPLHTHRPSRNGSQPPSPSSHYYQPGTELLTPASSQPPSPSGAYFSSPSPDGAPHTTPPLLPFCHVSPTSSTPLPTLGSNGATGGDRRLAVGTRSPNHPSTPTSPSNHYYHDPRHVLHLDHAAAAHSPRRTARFASQPPSPSSGYYPSPLFSSPPPPEPIPPPQMPASARYQRNTPREPRPPSPPPNYFPHSRSVTDIQNLLLQSPAPAQGRPGRTHRGSTGSLDTSSLMPPPLSPGPNYFVPASGPSTTTRMAALPGETDEQFARRLAAALWQSVNQQGSPTAARRSSPPPFAPTASAAPSAPPTARSHLAPSAAPRNPALEPSPAPPNTARHARPDNAQQHSALPSTPPAFSCSGSSPFDDLTTCVICMSRPREAGFLHGETVHNCACRECAKLIPSGSACPMCRQPIERVLGIY